ncbi:hypothetical protein PV327_010499 [Microctonus hyperodae]|uniref:U6 small nuclear RNA (adenine-(43)-N(6))-methyltransferase n=1 Tax=Microctonus hyperodae TaxID=165561 RepID=A0AA39FSZ7_MICHY|nr:hypothetical protein PV327_010499 [Microctonus hyperodae]
MSLRKFMHPRNKYKIPPKFKDLAALYPEFKQHIITDLTGKLRFNFKNEESLRVLAKTLLKHDFNLEVEIPHDKLVPALPLRLNYILWIEDLMKHAKINNITGTGAVCIYPLLCARVNGWKMIATEIDSSSVTSAMENVRNNCLDELINVVAVNGKYILKDVVTDEHTYSFTMCNPPFFDLDKSDEIEKSSPPRNAQTGNKIELTVDGGEYSFVKKIIDESAELGNKIQIYTSMIGLKNNLSKCLCELKQRNIENLTWTEFCQGRTKRWGLAWSFVPKNQFDLTTAPVIRTKTYSNNNNLKKNVTEFNVPLMGKFPTVDHAIAQLKLWVYELKIDIKELTLMNEEFDGWTFELSANEDTWSHARRKRRMLMQREQSTDKKICIENDTELKQQEIPCRISSSVDSHLPNNKKPYLVLNLAIEKLNFDANKSKSTDENEEIKIYMIYQSGYGGKNALETFKQYLINKFEIREYIQQHKKRNAIKL